MKIPILEVDKKKFFHQFLTIINPINLHLTDTQIKTLATICYFNYMLKEHPTTLRFKLLFSPVYKKQIRESLDISEANFNNIIMELKKKKLLLGTHSDLELVGFLSNISPEKDNVLTFNWNVK